MHLALNRTAPSIHRELRLAGWRLARPWLNLGALMAIPRTRHGQAQCVRETDLRVAEVAGTSQKRGEGKGKQWSIGAEVIRVSNESESDGNESVESGSDE